MLLLVCVEAWHIYSTYTLLNRDDGAGSMYCLKFTGIHVFASCYTVDDVIICP